MSVDGRLYKADARTLRDKKIGYNEDFLREIIKEVSVRVKEIILTYKYL